MNRLLALIAAIASFPITAYATTTPHDQLINMAGCRSVYDGTTEPFKTYIEFDNYNQLYDFVTIPSYSAASAKSALVCDFRLPDTTVEVNTVTMWYRATTTSNIAHPVINVVVEEIDAVNPGGYEWLWEAYSEASCTGSGSSSNGNAVLPCVASPYYQFGATGYQNYAAYAVITWDASGCSGESCTNGFGDVMSLDVNYSTTP